MKSPRPHIAVFVVLLGAVRAETCYSQAEIAGIIFGCIFGALVISIGVALILLFIFHKHRSAEQILLFEKAHATQETEDFSESSVAYSDKNVGPDYSSLPLVDKFVSASPLLRRRPLSTYQRFLNEHSVHRVESDASTEHLALRLQHPEPPDSLPAREDSTTTVPTSVKSKFQGLGFDIREDDGIVVANLHPDSPAFSSGNIFIGDRLRKVTIDLENMNVDDAFMLLSFIAPFKIMVELERSTSTVYSRDSAFSAAIPMTVKSNTFSCHPNTIINMASPMCLSLLSVQKHALPRENSIKSGDEVGVSAESESDSVLRRSSSEWTSARSRTEMDSERAPSHQTSLLRSERIQFDLLPRVSTFSESSTSEDAKQIPLDDKIASVVSPPSAVTRCFQVRGQHPQAVGICAFYEPLTRPPTQIPRTIPLPRRCFARFLTLDYAASDISDAAPRGFSLERFSARHRPLQVTQTPPVGSFVLRDAFQPFVLNSAWIFHPPMGFCSRLSPPAPAISTPQIVEMRVKTAPSPRAPPPEVQVVDRQLPELPPSAFSPPIVVEEDSDRLSRLYRSVKRRLRPTSTILPF